MRKILILILFCLSVLANAQTHMRFYTAFGGPGEEVAYSVKQTLDGHYIVVGSTSSYGNGSTDVYFVKIDSTGNTLWQKYYGGIGSDVGKSVIQLQDSGYVIAGFTNSYGVGGYDAFLVRVDKNGEMLWQRTYGGPDWDFANDLVQAADGNLFVVGYTSSFGAGNRDGFVVKYDLLGNELLHKFIGGIENDELNSIIKTQDGFLATVGYTQSKGDLNGDGHFLKLDLNADTLFTVTFGGPNKDFAMDLVQRSPLEGSDYYIAGARTFSNESMSTQSYMYRISPAGSFLSDGKEFRNYGNEYYVSNTNSYQLPYLTGFARTINFPITKKQEEINVAFTNGYLHHVNAFGGYLDETVYCIEGTRDGGFVSVGHTESFGAGGDAFLIKRDSTIINYSSIVSVPEMQVSRIFPSIAYEDNYANVLFPNNAPKIVYLYDMGGRKLAEFNVSENSLRIDLSGYIKGLYLLEIKYFDRPSYRLKILAR